MHKRFVPQDRNYFKIEMYFTQTITGMKKLLKNKNKRSVNSIKGSECNNTDCTLSEWNPLKEMAPRYNSACENSLGSEQSVHYGSPLMNSLNLFSQGPVRVTITNTYANKSQLGNPK